MHAVERPERVKTARTSDNEPSREKQGRAALEHAPSYAVLATRLQ